MSFLNLLVLRCADIERSSAFYECLDLKFEQHSHGTSPVHLVAADDWAMIIELYPATTKNPADKCGLGFGTPNLEKAAATLRSRGFEPDPIKENPWGPTFVVRDPDGRRVEVKLERSDEDPEYTGELLHRVSDHEKRMTDAR